MMWIGHFKNLKACSSPKHGSDAVATDSAWYWLVEIAQDLLATAPFPCLGGTRAVLCLLGLDAGRFALYQPVRNIESKNQPIGDQDKNSLDRGM
jgi:hypothetical protein